ncbi:MAG TPA: RNA methyltransferase [Acidimicrobiales bacterium]|nr:RNA methyltransferase [Acidimicrobiales bacterium]
MIVDRLDDPGDPRLDEYLGLTDPERRRGRESGQGLFIAEGRLVLERVVDTGLRLRSVMVLEPSLPAVTAVLDNRELPADGHEVPVYVVGPAVAERVTGYDVHRGILAAVDRPPRRDPWELAASAATIVVLEDLTDQVNIGTVFRNAAALGGDAVLLSPGCGDPLYRRAVRVSMGAVVAIPFARVDRWPDAVARLGDEGFDTWALTPDPEAEPIVAPGPGRRVALVLGSEGPGLTEGARRKCRRRVRIAMAAGADSLNVATAAAIALHVIRSSAGP